MFLSFCLYGFYNTVKEIDKKRLQDIYTADGGKKFIKPEKQEKYLGIDEFKLHNGHRYATQSIDLETGHILWIQNGKKKQVVYDFIDLAGPEWMDGVEAVACDMNSEKTRYILMSNRSTLQKKDEDAASEQAIHKGSLLFKTEDIKRKSGYGQQTSALVL